MQAGVNHVGLTAEKDVLLQWKAVQGLLLTFRARYKSLKIDLAKHLKTVHALLTEGMGS